eukprot:symbB.v1.2.027616.t1/scaffold2845.1/size69024/4
MCEETPTAGAIHPPPPSEVRIDLASKSIAWNQAQAEFQRVFPTFDEIIASSQADVATGKDKLSATEFIPGADVQTRQGTEGYQAVEVIAAPKPEDLGSFWISKCITKQAFCLWKPLGSNFDAAGVAPMEVSRNRSWRPPANATTFSFGPWVTCHCAHGAVEEPEMRIHADEDVRRAPSQKLRLNAQRNSCLSCLGFRLGSPTPKNKPIHIHQGMKTEDVRPSEFSLKKPPLQLPEAAIPEREERRNGREVLSKATAATSALKRVQLPVDPPAPVRSGCKKVMIASLVFIVIGGLVLLAGGYPVAEHLANDLKEHNCKLSSPDVHEASLGEIPYVQYSLTPGVSCWVQLEIETPCQGSAPCWSPSPLQHAGWTLMTFEDPKEFLSPRSTCNTRVGCPDGVQEEKFREVRHNTEIMTFFSILLALWAALSGASANDGVNRSHFLGRSAVEVTAMGAKCGPIDSPENAGCKEVVEWAAGGGKNDPSASGWFRNMPTIAGVTYGQGTVADFQRLYYCAPPGKDKFCGLPPCTGCSNPPCNDCFAGHPMYASRRPGCDGNDKGVGCVPPKTAMGYKGQHWPTSVIYGVQEIHKI